MKEVGLFFVWHLSFDMSGTGNPTRSFIQPSSLKIKVHGAIVRIITGNGKVGNLLANWPLLKSGQCAKIETWSEKKW